MRQVETAREDRRVGQCVRLFLGRIAVVQKEALGSHRSITTALCPVLSFGRFVCSFWEEGVRTREEAPICSIYIFICRPSAKTRSLFTRPAAFSL